jgi:trehalose-phosphatase
MPANPDLEALIRVTREHGKDVLLFLAAFDGVLTDYCEDPADVQVPRSRLAILQRLQQAPDVVVGVISGRPIADLRTRIPLGDRAVYIGLHGLEAAGDEFAWTRMAGESEVQTQVHAVAARLRDVVADIPGVRLECKGPVIALHTRQAGSEDAVWSRFQLLSAAADLLNGGAVQVLRGNEVFELLPNLGHPRADAWAAIRRSIERHHHRHVFTVYVGEDTADDDAVDALVEEDAVAAVLGRRRSNADYHLRSPEDVDFFMTEVIASRRG